MITMAIQECGLNLNSEAKELQPHGTLEFPCAAYASYHTERQEDIIPWHWHDEMELILIEEGRMKLKTSSETFLLESGDMAAINSDILHYGAAVGECRLRSLVFSPMLIAGSDDSVYAKKYIRPLTLCNSFSCVFIDRENKDLPLWFNTAFEALAKDSYGFEFIVRDNLSRICFYLYDRFKEKLDKKEQGLNRDNLRIRKMLEFIHENFEKNLSLADISNSADISERECMRCFQKTIQISPVQYLLKYRIMHGAEMLIHDRKKTISEIATYCGFDSPCNFTKLFRRFYNCTPREYRQKHTEHTTERSQVVKL